MTALNKIVYILIILFPVSINAQDAEQYLGRAQYLQRSDLDSSNWYATRAFQSALDSKKDDLALDAQFLLALNLQMQGSLKEAISVYKKVISSNPKETFTEKYIQAVGRIGDCYTDLAVFDSAMVYLIEFDQLVDQHWSPNKIDAKLLLGELYGAMGRMDRSDEYKIEAIERAERSENNMERTIALYYYLEDHKSELHTEFFQKYYQDYINLVGNRTDHIDISHLTMLLEDFDEKEKIKLLENGIRQSEKSGYYSTLLMYRAALIDIHIKNRNYNEALLHAENGLKLTQNVDDKRFETDFNHYLFEINEGLKKYEKAIFYLQKHHLLKDSIENVITSKNLDELNIQYNTAQKENQINQQDLALQKSKYQQNILIAAMSALIWFGSFLILYFWNKNRMTKKFALQESNFNQQEIKKLEQEKQLLAMSSMIEGQEEERKRIAMDLHDGLGGILSNIKAQLSALEKKVNEISDYDLYGKASGMIDNASREVRRIAYNMMPMALSRLGLIAAIEDFITKIEQSEKININTQINGLDTSLDETKEVMIYRIIQELINNVVKHAKAENLLVQVNEVEANIIITVEDDGIGFDLDEKDTFEGLGLRSVASRVKFLGGTLDILSNEEGSSFNIHIPL